MSSHKKGKMNLGAGMSMALQLVQKPVLEKCYSASCDDCHKEHPVEKYPRGFYCPEWKTKNIPISIIPRPKRKTFEDHSSF